MRPSRRFGDGSWACAMMAVACVAGCGSSAVALQWWSTCGDPVFCSGHQDAGIPACTTETLHARCTNVGAECDPGDQCNTHLVCSDRDPRLVAGCPISRASAKTDVRFLTPAELRAYRDEILAVPLATFRYRDSGPGSRVHLGFLIDGHESLACVDADRDQVDLYGYASMAVAALQVQAREIEQLRKQVAALQARVDAAAPAPRRRTGPAGR